MTVEFFADNRFAPDQQDFNAIVPRRLDGPFDLRLGGAVRAHGIERDDRPHCQWEVRESSIGVPSTGDTSAILPTSFPGLRDPYSNRTWGRRDEASCAHDSSGIRKVNGC